MSITKKRGVLGGVAGLLVAGTAALVLTGAGSGATFSQSNPGSSVTVTQGAFQMQVNGANNGTFALAFEDLLPGGDVQEKTFTVQNTGAFAMKVSAEIGAVTGLAGLSPTQVAYLEVQLDGEPWKPVTALSNPVQLGTLAKGAPAQTHTVKMRLNAAAGNEWTSRTISAPVIVNAQQS